MDGDQSLFIISGSCASTGRLYCRERPYEWKMFRANSSREVGDAIRKHIASTGRSFEMLFGMSRSQHILSRTKRQRTTLKN
jgi:hypothetical protein